MTSQATTTTSTTTRHGRNTRAGAAFRAHLRNEFRLLTREPAALIFGALLPLAAITVMVLIPATKRPNDAFGGVSVVESYTPVLVLFATSMLGLTITPGILGNYRERGVLKRLRTTPSSPMSLLAALFVIITVVGLLVAAIILGIAAAGGSWPRQPARFGLVVLLSTLCFVAMGTVIASVIPSAKAAPGVGNAVAVVMWAASGLWFPRAAFPDWLLTVADLTPGGAASGAMLDATIGAPTQWIDHVVLLVWTLVCILLASRLFRWE